MLETKPAVRMVACDIDGTLLQGEQTALPAGFGKLLDRLEALGIRFCVASGRQYANLRELFGPLADRISYVCENGSLVFGPGGEDTPLCKTVLPPELIRSISESVLELPGCHILLSGLDTSYPILKDPALFPLIAHYCGSQICPVDSPAQVHDEIIQASAYCCPNARGAYEILSKKWSDVTDVVIASENWIDFPASCKGAGLKALCGHLAIAPSEVMAFGDNFNDISMLDLVGHPVLMENAPDTLKERYQTRCRDVCEALEQWLDSGALPA